ncbi:MAG: aminotransferase class I/II-fold pyridoxal phosphate-dependent enzyme [Clostridiales bacterium]|jgi:arginine decarboxylase|nr:aminotransferase class I/II-fold pyridoxal phosphate-dependent enzyme [Clostridiales bacterium]
MFIEREGLFLKNQDRAPIFEALEEMKMTRTVPFDVPGHKRGKGNKELTDFLGEKCLMVDVNSMKLLDNLCHPTGVIKEAEELAADAFGASHAFFMVGGTTSSVQAMVLSAVKKDEKIILPRNVHRSVINSLILCGAIPVYINPQMNERLGISLGMTVSDVKKAIMQNKDAKAILINNPTYYGICSNLAEITKLAHENNMLVLVDEAHGTHFYFGENMPATAMSAGADFSSVSMHKSGGSLTQSSFLLCGENVNENYVRQIINLTQTTSGSYLLISSLDISRRNLARNGKEIFAKVYELSEYAREEINQIGDYYAYSKELVNGDSIYDFDTTKLSVNTLDLGLAGIEVYDLLRDEYDIQIEFGDIGNILAYISVGDNRKNIERLIGALSEIRRIYKKDKGAMIKHEYINPIVALPPQQAFYAEKKSTEIENSVGEICCEFVMCYPPGIPILAPGERVTKEIVDYIFYAKEKGCSLTGPENMDIVKLNVLKGGT